MNVSLKNKLRTRYSSFVIMPGGKVAKCGWVGGWVFEVGVLVAVQGKFVKISDL